MRSVQVVFMVFLGMTSCSTSEVMRPPANLSSQGTDARPPPSPTIGTDPACRLFSWPLPPDQAASILRHTQIFASTGVYEGGTPTPQVAAFNVLLDQADPVPYFDDLARSADPAGRLYTLCAFQVLDRERGSRL